MLKSKVLKKAKVWLVSGLLILPSYSFIACESDPASPVLFEDDRDEEKDSQNQEDPTNQN
jgi:hypothetical protein